MPDGEIKGNRSCDYRKPDCYHGEQCESERNAIIEHPVTIKVDDPAFLLPGFQAARTEVLATPFYVAQSA